MSIRLSSAIGGASLALEDYHEERRARFEMLLATSSGCRGRGAGQDVDAGMLCARGPYAALPSCQCQRSRPTQSAAKRAWARDRSDAD